MQSTTSSEFTGWVPWKSRVKRWWKCRRNGHPLTAITTSDMPKYRSMSLHHCVCGRKKEMRHG